MIAYDLETTRIDAGTPDLRYVTAHGESMRVSMPVYTLETFRQILEQYFLIPENNKAQFIAWNGNRFDAFFVVKALLTSDAWVMHPFMTASKSLRGVMVKSAGRFRVGGKRIRLRFQFLDGMSMTGLAGMNLQKFLAMFAPELPKLKLDLSEIEFNPNDREHVKYAERDSEGLYVAMQKVSTIINDLTGLQLKPTIGNVAINYFMDHVPAGKSLLVPTGNFRAVLNGSVKRGGYCWCAKQYVGPVWKYDINQAYAAAMRDAALPCGDYCQTLTELPGAGVYEVVIKRKRPSLIPFYYKSDEGQGLFTTGRESVQTWLTSIEVAHLRRDKWDVTVLRGFAWSDTFNFSSVVDTLEALRKTDPQGPSGPLGTMVKAVGNNAYGKTLEQPSGLELVIAATTPEGYELYEPFEEDSAFIFSRARACYPKRHNLPQVGIFVTAHVRCVVREAAMLAPRAFLYADTDCVVFSRPVSLDIDKVRYGAWKQESAGEHFIIVGKKIYYGLDDHSVKAKGLYTRELNQADFEKWLEGNPPAQTQLHKENLLKFIAGNAMFHTQDRKGTDVSNSKIYRVQDGQFIPS